MRKIIVIAVAGLAVDHIARRSGRTVAQATGLPVAGVIASAVTAQLLRPRAREFVRALGA